MLTLWPILWYCSVCWFCRPHLPLKLRGHHVFVTMWVVWALMVFYRQGTRRWLRGGRPQLSGNIRWYNSSHLILLSLFFIIFVAASKHWPWLIHTASFWNINIQWTSHDDLTEKLVLVKPPQMEAGFFVKSQSVALTFSIWRFFWTEIWHKPLNWSGGQTHGWILMK